MFVGSPDYIVICIRGQSGNRQSEMKGFESDQGIRIRRPLPWILPKRIIPEFWEHFFWGKLFDFENSGKLEEEFGLWPWGM